jgi:uncharacterized protein (DUF305 family)
MKAALGAGLLVGLLAAGTGPAGGQAHDHGAAAAAGPAPATGSPYRAADLQFLSHMIVHHEQALELCALVPARSAREEFHRFARYLNDAQQAEIDQMRGLLRLAADRGAATPPMHLHGDPPMAGMLSKAQMAAIAAAADAPFERLWLEGMILHHQGAVEMALAQQEAQFRSGNQPWGVDVLVDEMLAVQRAEIAKMRGWLRDWSQGAAPAP